MSHLFKSKKQRERDARKARRRAFRDAENRIADVKLRIKRMDKDVKEQWNAAKDALRRGDEEASERCLIGYRSQQALMLKLEQKRWVFEQYVQKLESAETDAAFSRALANINRVTDIDPDRVENVFEAASDLLGEQMEVDAFWDRLHERELHPREDGAAASLPNLDALRTKLAREVSPESEPTEEPSSTEEVDQRLRDSRDRLNHLLDNE